jgi:TolA-binding protein
MRAVGEFPASDATPVALSLVSVAAGRGGEWPLTRETFQLLTQRYPGYKTGPEARFAYAEALYRTGSLAEAGVKFQEFIAASPKDPELPRALILLGRTREAAGDGAGALELYKRVEAEFPAFQGPALLGKARVLQVAGDWDEVRPLLERAIAAGDSGVAAEAAYRLGEGLRGAGRHQQAVDSYMTAVYVAPDTPVARRALLGAGQSFTALKQPDSAIIVYKKLLTGKSVEPDVADAAKKGLKDLGVN